MNVETLHRVLIDLIQEEKDFEILDRFRILDDLLFKMVESDKQKNGDRFFELQTKYNAASSSLIEALNFLPSNNYGVLQTQILNSIFLKGRFGFETAAELEAINDDEYYTPVTRYKVFVAITTPIKKSYQAIADVIKSFTSLNIDVDRVKPGFSEIHYIIPQHIIDGDLSKFEDEIKKLRFILYHIAEVMNTESSEVQLKKTSSSDFLIIIDEPLKVAAATAAIIAAIITTYKSILEIKEKKKGMSSNGLPEEITKQIDDFCNTKMQETIERLVVENMEHYNDKGDGRKEELETAFSYSLNLAANNIDRGMRFEFIAEPAIEPKDQEVDDDKAAQIAMNKTYTAKIMEQSKEISTLKNSSGSILKLKEPDEGNNA